MGTFDAQQVLPSGASDVQTWCIVAVLAAGQCLAILAAGKPSPAVLIILSVHPLAMANMCDDTAGPLTPACRCPHCGSSVRTLEVMLHTSLAVVKGLTGTPPKAAPSTPPTATTPRLQNGMKLTCLAESAATRRAAALSSLVNSLEGAAASLHQQAAPAKLCLEYHQEQLPHAISPSQQQTPKRALLQNQQGCVARVLETWA